QVADLRLAVAGHEQDARQPVPPAEVADERLALGARLVAEAQRRGVLAADEHHALQTRGPRRQRRPQLGALGEQLLAAGDLDLAAIERAVQPTARRLSDGRGVAHRRALLLRRGEESGGKRVLGVALEAGDQTEQLAGVAARSRQQLRQPRLAVGQRAGLVEYRGAAAVDL